MNRRDLLKLFGVGAAIAPVVKGIPQGEAIIVKPPVVELAPEPQIIPPGSFLESVLDRSVLQVTVFARNPAKGTCWRMDCSGFVANVQEYLPPVEIHSTFDPSPFVSRARPRQVRASIEMTGEMRLVFGTAK